MNTERLQLDAVVEADLDEHWALLSDPDVWRHLPSGVHTDRAQTLATLHADAQHWAATGLGYWSARLLSAAGALPAGAFVGVGGCALREGTQWWNAYYRLTPPAWGLGLAAELVAAGLDAARAVRPDLPIVAFLLEHNVESRGRAERSGLTLQWRGPDLEHAGLVRLVHADRALSPELLARILART